MEINKIDHIGVAVSNLNDVKELFSQLFDLNVEFEEEVSEQKVSTFGYDINGTNLEFLEATSSESPISKFVEKRKNAVHHIALQVDDLDAALSELKEKKIRLIDEEARIGAEGKRIAFLHPKATAGILIELSEKKRA